MRHGVPSGRCVQRHGTLNAFTVVAKDNVGAEFAPPAVQVQVTVTGVNDIPTVTTMAAPVDTVAEDTQVQITFAEIAAQGNEADVDGTVTAFVVKGVTTGTLLIGTNAGTATAFVAGVNDTIDATRSAFWTGASNANGTLNAFTVVAKDNVGAELCRRRFRFRSPSPASTIFRPLRPWRRLWTRSRKTPRSRSRLLRLPHRAMKPTLTAR